MSVEQNKQLVETAFDRLVNHGEISLVDEFVGEDFVNHDAPPGAPRGSAGLRYVITVLRTAFPDIHCSVEELIAEDDKVVARTTVTGTHLGDFFGVAPTGRQIKQDQIHILHFRNGKTVEHRSVRDDLRMLRQLGLVPDGALPGS